jgi:hypothetical protein
MSKLDTTCESQGTHIFGRDQKCLFCKIEKPPIDYSKEAVWNFIKQKRDTTTGDERAYFACVYFVLRNRTEENWGPKELTMGEAMRHEEMP